MDHAVRCETLRNRWILRFRGVPVDASLLTHPRIDESTQGHVAGRCLFQQVPNGSLKPYLRHSNFSLDGFPGHRGGVHLSGQLLHEPCLVSLHLAEEPWVQKRFKLK